MSDLKKKREQELTRLRVKHHRQQKRATHGNEEDFESSSATTSYLEEYTMGIEQYDLYDENTVENCLESSNMIEDSSDNVDDDGSINRSDEANPEMDMMAGTDEEVDQMADEELDIMEASMDEDEFYERNNVDEYDEITELRAWALSANVAHTRLDKLLEILKVRLLPNLPKSSKTFLNTASANYHVRTDEDSNQFVYFGLTETLQKSVNPNFHPDNIINLKINVDGVQLFKSSSRQFWPILCQVHSKLDVYQPFPVAIHCGMGKPKNLDQFLEQFVQEINHLHENGLEAYGHHLQVKIISLICDRPARAFLKRIIGHGGYFACERCTVRGERAKNRTVYPISGRGVEPRTNYSFRTQMQPQHHQGITPLLNIRPEIDMILAFTLDFMHLVCLGIMKKLLNYWLHGDLAFRLSYASKLILSNLLIKFQGQIPQEFQRSTRSFADVEKFKATEMRFLILYCGPIIFKKVLPNHIYKHFLLLHAGCRILCSRKLAVDKRNHAKKFLTSFVSLAERLYGKESLISNMHNLVHLADDVRYMNCSLSYMTAFPFENALGILKKFLRNGNKPLAQIIRRLHESFFSDIEQARLKPQLDILRALNPNNDGETVIKRIRYKGVVVTSKSPDNTVLLDNNKLLEIKRIFIPPHGDENDIKITGNTFKKVGPLYTEPCNSEDLHMWAVSRRNTVSKTFYLHEMNEKMLTLDISTETEEEIYTMPLLHM